MRILLFASGIGPVVFAYIPPAADQEPDKESEMECKSDIRYVHSSSKLLTSSKLIYEAPPKFLYM